MQSRLSTKNVLICWTRAAAASSGKVLQAFKSLQTSVVVSDCASYERNSVRMHEIDCLCDVKSTDE